MPHSPFDLMMEQVEELPLWIKQVIYVKLRHDLENSLAKSTMNSFGEGDTLQLLEPRLTSAGQQEILRISGRYGEDVIRLLQRASEGNNVLGICLQNNWTLETCAFNLLEAIDEKLMDRPDSGVILATIEYLANKTRLGEYLVKIGRVSVQQLDQALQTQEYIFEALGQKTGIGNVLINLGYITREDSEGILFLKEESKKQCPDIPLLNQFSGAQPRPPKPQAQPQVTQPVATAAGMASTAPTATPSPNLDLFGPGTTPNPGNTPGPRPPQPLPQQPQPQVQHNPQPSGGSGGGGKSFDPFGNL